MYLVRVRVTRLRDRARVRVRVRVKARVGVGVRPWLVRHRGERVVPAEHDILGVGDLVREEDVEGLGAPIPPG